MKKHLSPAAHGFLFFAVFVLVVMPARGGTHG
jgi:hypothetical protein